MNTFMLTILSLSLSGALIVAWMFLLKPVIKRHMSKRWQYYVWLIVIVRLMVPFSAEINFIGGLINNIPGVHSTNAEMVEPMPPSTHTSAAAESGGDILNIIPPHATEQMPNDILSASEYAPNVMPPDNVSDIFMAAPSGMTASLAMIWYTILQNLWMVWLSVAIMLLIRKITIYQSFVRYIKAGRVEVSDIGTLERFGQLVESANIKNTVGIYTNPLISSPMLIGFFRPYIVFPTLNISEADFKYTVLHELVHYKRGDMFYKWLVQLTICVHWFNPLVHLMGNEINKACEFSCDEAVIKDLDYDEVRGYGDTLLNALSVGGQYRSALSAVTLNENTKILKERLDMIMKFRKKSKLNIVFTLMFTLLISIGAAVAGVYAETNAQTGGTANQPLSAAAINSGLIIIDQDFEINIPHIASNEVVRIGRLMPVEGYVFHATVTAGRGNGLFLGVSSSANAHINLSGVMWTPFRSGNNVLTDFILPGDPAYFYVGSSPWGIGGALHDVSVYLALVPVDSVPDARRNTLIPSSPTREEIQDLTRDIMQDIMRDLPIPAPFSSMPPMPTPSPMPFVSTPPIISPQRNADELDLHAIMPFVSSDVAAELAWEIFESEDINLNIILPFISSTAAGELARAAVARGDRINLRTIIPFVSSGVASELALDAMHRGDDIDLITMLPFVSSTAADELARAAVARGDNVNLKRILPFVSTAAADELVLYFINTGQNFDARTTLPFVSPAVANEIARWLIAQSR